MSIFQPLSLATKPDYQSPSTINNATLIACGNATRNTRFIQVMKAEWTGNDTRHNANSPHKSYVGGNSPHLVTNRLYSITLPPNSLIKIRKPQDSYVYASSGINGNFTIAAQDEFVTVTKIGYTD